MEKQYFIHNGTQQDGPFTIDELKQKRITAKTMIWFEGIQNWTEAQFIPELKAIATPIPPPFEKAIPAKEIANNLGNNSTTDVKTSKDNLVTTAKIKQLKLITITSVFITAIVILVFSTKGVVWGTDLKDRDLFVIDSLIKSKQKAITLINEKLGVKRTIDSLEIIHYQLQQKNIKLNARLSSAQDNLNSAYQFHFLRTQSEREAQIESASLWVNKLKQDISNIKQQYIEVENSLRLNKDNLASIQ